MLPLPNLDDRTFEQLVREARDLIPRILPAWTDQNAHDPGITLLEMLAWHIEMQQFQLDRLTIQHERKFLKLLGEAPRDRIPATTSVSFSKATHPLVVPTGTLLRVADLPFETVRAVTVLPDSKQQVTVQTKNGSFDVPPVASTGQSTFYPFGEEASPGSSMRITLEDPLPHSMLLSLWIELDRQEPVHRIPARYQHFTPSGQVEWSYWHEEVDESGDSGHWRPVWLERDETYGLHQSGPILFQIPTGMDNVLQIKATLTAGSYHDPPRIRQMLWNEVFAQQGQTYCLCAQFDGLPEESLGLSNGPDKPLSIELEHALFQQGELEVQFKRAGGEWIDVEKECFEIYRADNRCSLVFLPDISLPRGEQSIRVIATSPQFIDRIYLGSGTGISGQSFPLPIEPVLPDQVKIQVGWLADDQKTMLWHDWERVRDFDDSHANSRHFVIDEDEGVIRFSDGVHGIAPPSATYPNIRWIQYRVGTGAAGNVKEDTIHEMDLLDGSLQVTNLYPAYGGAEAETVQEALQRVKQRVIEPVCGVTAEDLEKRVLEIPGLRIVRVKAIPGYRTGWKDYPQQRAVGHVSLVIVPYSQKPLPRPSDGMIQTVKTHLEPYRLLTTTIHVIAPEYIKVSVRAIVVVQSRYEGKEAEVKQILNKWLQPYGNEGSPGWDFGRPINKCDVHDVIHQVPGVLYIQDIWLKAEGKDVHHEAGGDIRIPPNGLVISGDHDIEFIISNR